MSLQRKSRLLWTVVLLGMSVLVLLDVSNTIAQKQERAVNPVLIDKETESAPTQNSVVGVCQSTGLTPPEPLDATLNLAEVDAMTRLAVQRAGGLDAVIEAGDWVVIKVNILQVPGPIQQEWGWQHIGTETDLRVVRSVIQQLIDQGRASRITVAEGKAWKKLGMPGTPADQPYDGWTYHWADYGGLSYEDMIAGFDDATPTIKVDYVDLDYPPYTAKPVPGGGISMLSYTIPDAILNCDKIIGIAPMKTHGLTRVTLVNKLYVGTSPASVYNTGVYWNHMGIPHYTAGGAPNAIERTISDLVSYHPADFGIVEGIWGTEGEGPQGGNAIKRNVILAGSDPVAVDAASAYSMGFNPWDIDHLHYCHNKGFGINNLDYITVNGPSLDDIRWEFVKPARGPGFYQGRGNRTWLVNGARSGTDIDQDYLGGLETTVSPVEGDVTEGYTWTKFSDIDDYMNLAAHYGAPTYCVTYAFTRIVAKTETTARLRFGADDGIKIWLNGTPVYTNGSTGGWSLVQQNIPITLQPGVNRLLVKIKNTLGDYGFSMFVCEPDGDTPMGIRYSTLAANAPEITLNAPGNNATTTNEQVTLSASVSSPGGAPLTVRFYGDAASATTLLEEKLNVPSGTTVSHTWSAHPLNVDANTIALWHFDEGTGNTVYDASGNGNNGTLNGATWTTGRFGPALHFNGQNQYVRVPDSDILNPTSAITIELWTYREDNRSWSKMMSKPYGLNAWPPPLYVTYGLAMQTRGADVGNLIEFPISINNQPIGMAPEGNGYVTIPTLQWRYIAVTFDGEHHRIYVDGELDREQDIPGTAPWTIDPGYTPRSDLFIGTAQPDVLGGGTGGGYYLGSLDEVRISNVARTPQEIANAYQSAMGNRLSVGDYAWRVTASDGTNQSVSETRLFTADDPAPDLLPPVITLNHPVDGYTTTDEPVELSATVDDPEGNKMTVRFYGGQTPAPSTLLYEVSNVTDPSDVTYVWNRLPAELNVEPLSTAALWHFNEGSGTTTGDASTNGNGGTISGATWTTGMFSSGLNFDGVDDYVQVADAASLDITGDLTLEAWIYPRALTTDRMIVNKRDGSGTCNYQMYINSDNEGLSFYAGGSTEYQSSLIPVVDQWNHVAVVYSAGTSAGTLTFYLNGQTQQYTGPAVPPASLPANSSPVQIGSRSLGTIPEAFNGLIDEVRVTNRALTPAEIALDYSSDLAPGTYYWKVTANDGTNEGVSGIRYFEILPNQAPAITLNHPDDESSTTAKSVELSATADDPEGDPMTVSFYGDKGTNPPTTLLYQQAGVADPSTLTYLWGRAPQELPVGVNTAALWHFSENTGLTTADATTNGNTGTLNGPTWTTGRFGVGLSFDGTNDYVLVSDVSSLDIPGELTLEAWIKPTALTYYHCIVAKRDAGASCNYQMSISATGEVLAFYNGVTEYRSTLVPTVGQWNYVAVVQTAGTLTFYLNGQTQTMAGPATLTVNNWPVQIGARSLGTIPEAFNGTIDEVRITNRALTPSEIASDYSAELAEGRYYWKATAADAENTTVSDVRYFDVIGDVLPPVITMKYPADGYSTHAKSVELSATVNDPEGSPMTVWLYGDSNPDPTTLLYQGTDVSSPADVTYLWGTAAHELSVEPGSTAGLWHLNEGSGTTAADAANSNTGTVSGAAWTAGKFGSALTFDGIDDYVEMPDHSSLDITGAVTIEAWVRFETIQSDWRVIAGKVNTSLNTSNYHLSKSDDHKFNFGFNSTSGSGGWHGYSSKLTVAAGQWYYVAATYSDASNEVRIYIDGARDTLYACPYSMITNDLPLRIGRNNNGLEVLNATIDEVRITNRTLTQQEVAANYSSELAEGPHYWKVVAYDGKHTTNSPAWHFDVLPDVQPPVITLIAPPEGYSTTAHSVSLQAMVDDPEGSPMTVWFYGDKGIDPPTTLLYQQAGVTDPSTLSYLWEYATQELPAGANTAALWHFNEGSGTTTVDAGAYGNGGNISGATWTTGRFGAGLSFDGTNDYVLVNDASSLDITGELTLEAWIKPTALTSYHCIVAKRDAGASCNYQMSISATGEVLAFYNGVTEYRSTLVPTVGQWNYVAVVQTAGALTFYLNGQTQQMAGPVSLTANDQPVQIGGRSVGGTSELFNGTIDELRITNRALTPVEIAASRSAPLSEGRYYWTVKASDGKNTGTSVVSFFDIVVRPPIPVLGTPADLALINDDTPTFTWSATAGPEGTYTLEYALDAGFTSGLKTFPGIGAETYTVPDGDRLADNTYFWHVQAIDQWGNPSGYQATPFSFTVNALAPDPPTAFAVAPGNEKCHLSWTNPSTTDFAGVMIRRNPWGSGAYPTYSGTPVGYPGTETEGTGVYSGTAESFDNAGNPEVMPRNIYYYTIFSFDGAGNYSAASLAVERKATNYWLGDIVADGSVNFDDVVPFSPAYGSITDGPGWNAFCDIGPSENGSRFGVPMPDGVIDFEDLMLLAMNYESVSPMGLDLLAGRSGTAIEDLAHLVAFEIVPSAENSYSIVLKNRAATLKGVHLVIEVSGGELARVERGARVAGRSDLFFGVMSKNASADISVAALGVGTPLKDSGEIARFTIAKGANDLAVVRMTLIDLRDVDNVRCEITSADEYDAPFVPKATALMQNFPNPFNPSTVLTFDLVSPEHVTIQIFDVSGRLVRTLVDAREEAGRHHIEWNGKDSNGSSSPSGIYFYRMRTSSYAATKKMILVR